MRLIRSPLLHGVAALAAMALLSCGASGGGAPDLPVSISPGWQRASLVKAPGDCWNASYTNGGSALVTVCRYASEAVALDAVQHARDEADSVHFGEGRAFVTVKWTGVSQAQITALVRAVQKALRR